MTTGTSTVTVRVPLRFTVRGGRKTIIGELTHEATRTRFDDSLTKAVARAYRWQSMIENGEFASITELAEARKINQSYACRILRLTLLAPDIVEAILDRRGGNLTLDKVMKPFPVRWDEQKNAFHFV